MIWGEHTFEEGKNYNFQLGFLQLWLRIQEEEVWLAYQHVEEGDQEISPDKPQDIPWDRWALKEPGHKLEFFPAFPDLPLVVKPENRLQLLPDASIQIFARVSTWLRIQTPDKSKQVIKELPSVIYSKTWFGTPFEGELSFETKTMARRKLPPDLYSNYLIHCGIYIQNQSEEILDFEKFMYRVERLDIYEKSGILWANDTTIKYQGAEQLSDVKMSNKEPEPAKGGNKISRARNPDNRGIASRTFHKFINEFSIINR